MIKHIGNMFFYAGETKENRKYIKIYSYKTLIGAYVTNPDEMYISKKYYSSATTRHQGLAHAIINRFDTVYFDTVVEWLEKCKSLKDIRKNFGYISKKFW